MAFGANIKNRTAFFQLQLLLRVIKKQSNTALFVDFSQIYFNVAMDIPDDGNIFLNENRTPKISKSKTCICEFCEYGTKKE